MSQQYTEAKKGLLEAVRQLNLLFALPQQLSGITASAFADWKSTCNKISEQLSEELVRVAVVGAIKSGKSTFVNSLLSGDYLKRGAGVVTSIVTRIRYGHSLKATLFFKSWDQVNRDIRDALVLLPNLDLSEEDDRFDIRRNADRKALRAALNALGPEQLITRNDRNANAVLLSSYLNGYARVNAMILADPEIKVFPQQDFDVHRTFVGDDALAVYLRDIELEINSDFMEEQFEIADCQGSDSSNPLHLAMIQDYLNLTHLIVYVISSRTGVRQADIRFLSMIKKMGIMDNILFVINCDFNEHGSLEDLSRLVEKTVEELAIIKPNPKVFTLSALYHLFSKIGGKLSEKDSHRYSLWQTETQMIAFSDANSEAFLSTFRLMLTEGRQSVLLRNHLERLERISGGVTHWLTVNREMVSSGEKSAARIAEKIKQYQERMDQVRAVMKTTLDGAVSHIKRGIKSDIDQFFGWKSSGIISSVLHFVKAYDVNLNRYAEDLSKRGFNTTMYQIFQDFRQALDTFMAESITPEILGFVRELEKKLEKELVSAAGPYDAMIRDAVNEFSRGLAQIGIAPMTDNPTAFTDAPDTDSIKHIAGLSFPSVMMTLNYSAKIKTEAIFRLGFYAALSFLKKALKKPLSSEKEKEISALSDGVRRMRRETEKTIGSHFMDYKENLKFQYAIKLADAVSTAIKETLLSRFQSYIDSLLEMLSLVGNKQLDEAHAAQVLTEMTLLSQDIASGLSQLRKNLGLTATVSGRGG